MKLVVSYKESPKSKNQITSHDVVRELNRIIRHEFFTTIHNDSIWSVSGCSSTQRHNKLLGLLLLIATREDIRDTCYISIVSGVENPITITALGDVLNIWEPFHKILKNMPVIEKVDISLD